MKKLLFFIAVLAGVIFVLPAQLRAQTVNYSVDTLDIAVLPAGNINDVINGDTLLGGSRAHPNRVYRLKPGAVYQVTQSMIINGKITVTSRDTIAGVRPPVLAPAILLDNSSIDHFFEFDTHLSSGELHNIYFLSIRSDGNQLGWSDAIRVYGDSVTLKLRGCVFDAFSDCALKIEAQWIKMDVQDCNFRNLMHTTSYYGGQAMETDAPNAMDTCKFINNTFFCCASYLWSIRGYDVYSIFAHNTIVYGMVNPFLIRSGVHMHINNNLFYSAHSYGGVPEDVINGSFLNYPDTASSPIIQFRCYDTVSFWSKTVWKATINGENSDLDVAHGVTQDMLNPADRSLEIINNDYVWPQKFEDYYTTYNDTVVSKDSTDMPDGSKSYLLRKLYHPTWMSDYVKWTIDSLLSKQTTHINIADNITADPGFNSDIAGHIDSVLAYVGKICTSTIDKQWSYKPSGVQYPPVWPLPENLAYSNTTLKSAGSDGFAVGDLNWFPSQKAQWLTDVKVDKGAKVPTTFSLSNAYPNPFNPTTNIQFNIAKSENVKLVVFNILGQQVKTLMNGELKAGSYTATWNGKDEFGNSVASGIYFYRLESQSFNATKKMILMK
ncbi:MAG: T9SS type A sorting domain-containing protein [Bacteroidota bacterium]|nr:T9SS type A sorting domain-containing protein [Bacteroidota bacterium]